MATTNKGATHFDPNFFYENQMSNINNTWDLYGPKINDDGTWGAIIDHSEPILSGILESNSLTVTGVNNFSSPDGLFGQIAGTINGAVGEINSFSSSVSGATGFVSSLLGGNELQNLTDRIGQNNETVGKLAGLAIDNAGAQVVTVFDQVKVFKGTTVRAEIPQLNTRIIYGTRYKRKGSCREDVRDVITDLNFYFQGLLSKVVNRPEDSDNTESGEIPDNDGQSEATEIAFQAVESLEDMIGIQAPPAGYLPCFRLVKGWEELKGTFTLRYGNYTIPNLIVTQFTYNISNQRVRRGKSNRYNSTYVNGEHHSISDSYTEVHRVPLYADISISLEPATYTAAQMVANIINGNIWQGTGKTEKISYYNGKTEGVSNGFASQSSSKGSALDRFNTKTEYNIATAADKLSGLVPQGSDGESTPTDNTGGSGGSGTPDKGSPEDKFLSNASAEEKSAYKSLSATEKSQFFAARAASGNENLTVADWKASQTPTAQAASGTNTLLPSSYSFSGGYQVPDFSGAGSFS